MTERPSYLDHYNGLDVLVTGHTGFKGTWLATWLGALGAAVSGLALEPEDGDASFYASAALDDHLDSRIGDIRELSVVEAALDAARPRIVFHLAAQALVRRSYRHPVDTFATNVLGTVNVLEAARRVDSVSAVVVVTSDKAYENPETGAPIAEGSPMGGRDPYSASKGAAELVTAAMRASFFETDDSALIASARAGNVIGAGDASEDRLLPDIVRALRADEPVVIRNPNSTRPWQHVLEPLRGYLTLGARLLEGDKHCASGWNFGPEPSDIAAVKEVVERVVEQWGAGTVEFADGEPALHEARTLSLDIERAKNELGFTPALDLDNALRLTVDGYRAIDGDTSTRDVLTRQITEYESLLL